MENTEFLSVHAPDDFSQVEKYIISGIQQIGIGVKNADYAWKWYKKYFGMDVPVFADKASASLMTRYTSGKVEDRYAILALNLQGGGGLEIWEYTSRTARAAATINTLGDLGIFAIKIKAKDIKETFNYFKSEKLHVIGEIASNPLGKSHFFVEDPFGNLFQIVENDSWLLNSGKLTGGVAGAIIGVSAMDTSINFYSKLLSIRDVQTFPVAVSPDLSSLKNGEQRLKRSFLIRKNNQKGAFTSLLGDFEIELIQAFERIPKKIFANRQWGDLGYIHMCFDVEGMNQLELTCAQLGHPFTVNSGNSFDMGKAAGQFSYCEDPDGTLIEFVETHKIPVLEKLNFFYHLKWRKSTKPLPNWFFKIMEFNKKS
jgi:catechol 2,3-dioxygenase-like lactoylglutathione lyase family enzyme